MSMPNGTVGFSADIRPKFRQFDIDAMRKARGLDLSSYGDVRAHADRILERLEMGDMPCDGSWPLAWVEAFRSWIAGGMKP